MEWVFIGMLIAIGFYFMPVIITAIIWIVLVIVGTIGYVFNSLFGRRDG